MVIEAVSADKDTKNEWIARRDFWTAVRHVPLFGSLAINLVHMDGVPRLINMQLSKSIYIISHIIIGKLWKCLARSWISWKSDC